MTITSAEFEKIMRLQTELARLTGEIKRLIQENENRIDNLDKLRMKNPCSPHYFEYGTEAQSTESINTRLSLILEPDAKRGKE